MTTGPGDGGDSRWVGRLGPAWPGATAEEVLRATWEGGPRWLRWFLVVGWRGGLLLRLHRGPSSDHVLGWMITERTPTEIRVDAASPLVVASNTVRVEAGDVVWETVVDYRNVVGRIVWALALPIHRLVVPYALRRARSVTPER